MSRNVHAPGTADKATDYEEEQIFTTIGEYQVTQHML